MEWSRELLGNSVQAWTTFFAILVGSLLVASGARIVVRRYLAGFVEKTATELDDAIVRGAVGPATWLVVIAGAAVAREGLRLPETAQLWYGRVLLVLGLVVLFVAVTRFVRGLIEVVAAGYLKRANEGKEEAERLIQTNAVARAKRQVGEIATMVIILIAVLTVLSNLGVDVKAIWASLGIGGVALAIAVKDPLTNVIGRAYIFTTGIFDEGQFIEFEQWSGTVKRVGVFRTTMELFSDMTTVSIPNANFIQKPVKNYFGRTKFMYKWDLDVPYDVDGATVEKLVTRLKAHILGKGEVNPDSTWIYLDRLGAHSKVVRVWFQAKLPDWASSLHYGSATLGEIQAIFDELGLDFAFPTRTVHLEGLEGLQPPVSE